MDNSVRTVARDSLMKKGLRPKFNAATKVFRRVARDSLMKKGLRPLLAAAIAADAVARDSLMKKGLRHASTPMRQRTRSRERFPDEEGIKTSAFAESAMPFKSREIP